MTDHEVEMARREHLAKGFTALDLVRRVPEFFSLQGWPHDGDLIAVTQAALSLVYQGAWGQRFRMPDAARRLSAWKVLVEGGKPTAAEIVAVLGMRDLLKPE